MARIRHKIAVISGKGGVGKSFVAANLAVAMALRGRRTGILDADFHGPSIPKILGVRGSTLVGTPAGVVPVAGPLGVLVVSVDFMLPSEETPLVWRGPLKASVLRELLARVAWGELDYLFIDLPPGTGDEPLSVVQLIRDLDGALVVTTPSDLSRAIVKKAISFARGVGVPVLGVVENMCGFCCPETGKVYYIFGRGGGRKMAEEMGVDFLGEIPLDPRINEANDRGVPFVLAYPDTEAAKAIIEIAAKMESKLEQGEK